VAARSARLFTEAGFGGLNERHDAGEALGQGVVDFAGQPLPFGQDPGLMVRRG
jgi:hypothetical protein